ncbi:MAG: restriction endonuclease subunit S [Acidimicrobiales bacterium]|jgi:type I restriction enzyme S subunit
MRDLPRGWELRTIADVGETRLGKQRSPKWHTGPNMRPYLRVANVFEDRIDVADVKSMHFAPHEVTTFELHSGDVLLNEGQSPEFLGRPAIYRGELPGVCFTNSLIRFRPHPGVLSEWALTVFRHHMHSGRFRQESRITTNIAHLSLGRLNTVEFPLPPTTEQVRIVAAIEEQLSRLDAGVAALEQAQRNLGRLRTALLGRAVDISGPRKLLGDVLHSLRNGLFVSRPAASPPGIAILRISAVRPMSLDATDIRYATVDADQVASYFLCDGDLLFTRYSGNPTYVGSSAVVRNLPQPTVHPDKLIRAVPDQSQVVPEFLALVLNTGRSRQEIESRLKTTAGQVGISGGQLKTVTIPLPPLERQMEMVNEVEDQLSSITPVAAWVEVALRRANSLRRALLAMAFRGELVAQDALDDRRPALVAKGTHD